MIQTRISSKVRVRLLLKFVENSETRSYLRKPVSGFGSRYNIFRNFMGIDRIGEFIANGRAQLDKLFEESEVKFLLLWEKL